MAISSDQPDWSKEATAEAQRRLSREGCIRARLDLAAPDEGGRRHGVRSGWLTAWDIGNEADGQRPDNDAVVVPEAQSEIAPGTSADVRLFPRFPQRWNKVGVGDVIAMRDGARRIGSAVVLELVEPTNEHLMGRWPMFSTVRFRRDAEGVRAGTFGAIIAVFDDAYEIEVVGPEGETVWAASVPDRDLELVHRPPSS